MLQAKMLLLMLLLLNRLTRNLVLQFLVSKEKHYLRNSMEESCYCSYSCYARSSITSSTVAALSPTVREGCTFSL
ncbi:hypothetical protein MKX03_026961 [Papaver bracteatum]|nr:hypothetical protein MKX03_026961 [Papaver bracteatum]